MDKKTSIVYREYIKTSGPRKARQSLLAPGLFLHQRAGGVLGAGEGFLGRAGSDGLHVIPFALGLLGCLDLPKIHVVHVAAVGPDIEIDSASRRDRVCQYMELALVAVSIQKKHKYI